MDVNFAFLREVKMTTACNFMSLGEKMCELLDKNGNRKKKKRRKEKRKITDHMIGQNICEICTLCGSVSWQS